MPSYDLFTCPGCEEKFRVIWPDPLPNHHGKHQQDHNKVLTLRRSVRSI